MPDTEKRKIRFKNIVVWTLLTVFGLLIVFRIFLPYLVLNYVNKKLRNLSEYVGHVRDIDIVLFRGAYIIKDMQIERIVSKQRIRDTIPFFAAPVIDMSIEWSALFKGALVGKIEVKNPTLNFVKGAHANENLQADTSDFRQLIRELMPLTLNHFIVWQGQIHYIDQSQVPALDLAMTNVMITGTNLSNVNDSSKILPAHLKASGNAYGGTFTLITDFDGLSEIPTFDLKAELVNLNLASVNDFLRKYGNFEVVKGTFGLYIEFAAKNGHFGGYVKPLLKDMKVALWNKKEKRKDQLWQLMLSGVALILKNRNTENVGTKLSIQGQFNHPKINIWRAIDLLLRNAFVEALKPSIDHSISINNLIDDKPKTFLEKLFGKKST